MSRLVGGRPDLAVWGVFAVWPLGALTGAVFSWPPGAGAILLMALPAVWIGWRLSGPAAGLFAALAGLCCASEATLLRVLRRVGEWYDVVLPGPADDRLFAPLAAMLLIALVFRALRDRPEEISLHPRSVDPRRSGGGVGVLEQAASLLSLQVQEEPDFDLSGAPRSLDGVVRSVRATARGCLRCEHASVWLWDGTRLREAGPPSGGNVRTPAPDPHTGLAGWAMEHRRPITRQTLGMWVARDRSLADALASDPAPPAGIAPLLARCAPGEGTEGSDETLLGLLIVDQPQGFDPQFAAVLAALARFAATALENARRFDQVQGRARRDDLTGLLRRDPLLEDLAAMLVPGHAQRRGHSVAAVIGDLDHFKIFNDAHGHPAGDAAIRQAANVWRSLLPAGARLCRYGGEEFLAALPDHTAAEAAAHAEKVAAAIRTRGVEDDGRTLPMTASFGVAAADPIDTPQCGGAGSAADRLIRRADSALFAAKEAGRDRVAVVDSDGILLAQPVGPSIREAA
ncbi:GGDEF domain-containing protein [Alienimonas sp. DA493]|uniref:sensor domain-containing diguanylate cyclase n=1 Tax=Alienimonas sp. DA493 TaxID=3373605 RepID=UPI003754CFB2